MEEKIITDGKYRYIEVGDGTPIIILHGLMGGLSNLAGSQNISQRKATKS